MTLTENNQNEEFNTTKKFDVRPAAQQKQAHPTRPVRTVQGQSGNASARPTQYGVVRRPTNGAPAQRPNNVSRNPAQQGQAARPTGQAAVRPVRPVQQTQQSAQSRPTGPQNIQRPIQQNAANQQAPVRQVRTQDANIAQTQNIDVKKTQSAESKLSGLMMETRVAPEGLSENIKKEKKRRDAAEKTDKKEKKDKNEKKPRSETTNTVVSVIKAIVYIMFVLVISAFLAAGIIKIGNDVFAFVKSDEIVEVTIPENATTDDVAQILVENKVISFPKIFTFYASNFRKYDDNYLAGTYSVSPSMNYDYLVAEFKPKAVSGTCEITIPEGFTTDEIIDLMVENGIGTREGYIDVIENGEFDYWFIDELEENGVSEDRIYRLDGYLFPDTYEFYLASSEWTVINKLLRRFSQIFTREYRDQCDALGYSVDEIVNLASIIEKEAGSPSEFFLVSSVFHNRLNSWQSYPRFESDATVVYVIQHETGERNVDLNYDTPYNTYLYDGFPPGPISNPSASAMLAALSPQTTNYYFFVSNNGTTHFSATKAEHDALVYKFKTEAEQQTAPQN